MANAADGREDLMDLDLNLEPPSSLSPSISERFRRIEEVTRFRRLDELSRRPTRLRRRSQPPSPPSPLPPVEPNIHSSYSRNSPVYDPRDPFYSLPNPFFQFGEGSVSVSPPEERRESLICRSCSGRNADLLARALSNADGEETGEEGKESNEICKDSAAGFFDCNICFEMASDPVLTSCGHLFCWPCLYQWLHVHSQAKECPVCKGEVADGNIIPIYGRGAESEKDKEEGEEVGDAIGVRIPPRPKARRIESLRQSVRRVDSSFSVQEIIQRIGTASRILSIREVVSNGQPNATPAENVVGTVQVNPPPSSNAPPRRVLRSSSQRVRVSSSQRQPQPPLDVQRASTSQRGSSASASASQRGSSNSQFLAISSAERLIQFFGNPMRRNEGPPQLVEDRDSVSRISGQSQGASMDVDSIISLSSSDGSRVSDVETGVPRTRRRRRLN